MGARRALFGVVAIGLGGCLASTLPSETNDHPVGDAPTLHHDGPRGANSGDSPEISRSVGQKGGIVVLWPRIIPKGDADLRELAPKIQNRLKEIAHANFPDAPIDVRPEPERVCPQSGCDGISVGVVIAKKEGGCAIAGLVAKRGPSPTQILSWLGTIKPKGDAPFREPPESYVTVNEYGECSKLKEALIDARSFADDGPIAEAMKAAMQAN